jgi:lipopolysaccharide export system protein LptA
MKKIFLFISLVLISISSISQTKIDFDSKYLFTTEELGPDIKVLTDSVVFKHENSIMFCDSALFNYATNYFDAFGNIRLIKPTKERDTVYLYGDTLHYSGRNKYAKVRNNVILEKDSLILFTDSLDYDLDKNMGYYFNKGVTLNGDDTLKSIYGYFYADDNEFFFKEQVEISNPDMKMFSDTLMHNTDTKVSYFMGPTDIYSDENYIYCENGWYDHDLNISQFNKNAFLRSKEQILKGDSLYYDKNKGFGEAFKNVTFKDTAQDVLLLGNIGFYNEKTGFAQMTDSAIFIQVSEKADSMFMHADTVRSYKDSIMENDSYRVYRIIQAYNHVKSYKSDFQTKCDSLVYDLKDSIIEMHVNPVIWADSNQLSADFIIIQTYKNEVDRIDMYDNAFIISQSDSVRFNQIFGKDMVAYIEDKELYQIDVMENGKSIYFIRDDDKKLIGVNFIECTNMELYFKDNKVDRIWFFDDPVGKIHPPMTLKESETKLENFKWDIAYRPENKYEIFVWKKEEQEKEEEKETDSDDTPETETDNEGIIRKETKSDKKTEKEKKSFEFK